MDRLNFEDLKLQLEQQIETVSETIRKDYDILLEDIKEVKATLILKEDFKVFLENKYLLVTGQQLPQKEEAQIEGEQKEEGSQILQKDIPVESIIEPSINELKSINRFWKKSNFIGWRNFIIRYIDRVDTFVTFGDLLNYTEVEEKKEREALTSAISNALTVSVKAGKIGRVTIEGEKGKFYGSLIFFTKNSVKKQYLDKLEERLNRAAIITEIESNYPYQESLMGLLDTENALTLEGH